MFESVLLEPGKLYHIWTHANGEENLFREDENYRFFLQKYKYHVSPVADTLAYCFMPNHLHLMVRIKSKKEIAKVVQIKNTEKNKNRPNRSKDWDESKISRFTSQQFSNLFNSYTKAYNKLYSRKGSLFIPRYKRKPVSHHKYALRLIAYIHLNPVHHGFVGHPNEWIHSSWQAYCLDRETKISKKVVLEWSGGKEAFMELHKGLQSGEVKNILEEVH